MSMLKTLRAKHFVVYLEYFTFIVLLLCIIGLKSLFIVVHKGRCTPWTMKSDHGRWHFVMVQLDGPTSMVQYLDTSIYKVFGPLNRCKQVWTKWNDHAPKCKCVYFYFYKYMSKKVSFEEKFKFDHSLVFSCLELLFPKDSFIQNLL